MGAERLHEALHQTEGGRRHAVLLLLVQVLPPTRGCRCGRERGRRGGAGATAAPDKPCGPAHQAPSGRAARGTADVGTARVGLGACVGSAGSALGHERHGLLDLKHGLADLTSKKKYKKIQKKSAQ